MTTIDELISSWQCDPLIAENFASLTVQPQKDADFRRFPDDLDNRLRRTLNFSGIKELYSHQVKSWDYVREGRNIVVTSGTASGKTLCYNLPVLQAVLEEPATRALYIFPTKALAQDQRSNLAQMVHRLNEINTLNDHRILSAVYDGDTPAKDRAFIRGEANIIISNPDMLHMGIMPHHPRWIEFFSHLRFIVLDEIHVYRGLFGSHVANVIRRLKRIAAFYGSYPRFVMTSATIANPVELAERLTEEKVSLISEDGSPKGKRYFILYNPPFINSELGLRKSVFSEADHLVGELLHQGIQTLLFTKTRRSVEVLLKTIRESHQLGSDSIRGYRSGYLAKERREIESGLRNGETRAVVATNALELGVDIGGMDAVMMVGYPGSIASVRQQAGRAGRKSVPSLAMLLGSANPIDQYLMRHPQYVLEKNPEHALIDPDALLILLQHIRCAAFELPFSLSDGFGSAPSTLVQGILQIFADSGMIHASGDRYYWTADQYPADDISLRTSSDQPVRIQAWVDDQLHTIGEVDRPSAVWMVHPQAIYLHDGTAYEVTELNLEKGEVTLVPSAGDFYTEPLSDVKIERLSIQQEKTIPEAVVNLGEIQVTSQVKAFRRIQWLTRANLGEVPLDLPPTQLRTVGCWIALQEAGVDQLRSMGQWTNDPNDYGPDWIRIRNLARRRDHFTCQICGAVETNGQTHHVHHKRPFRTFTSYEQANQLDNLITLCANCHQRAEMSVKMRSGLAGLSFAIHQMAALHIMSDINDLGAFSDPQAQISDGKPALVIYDLVAGGIGFSQRIYQMLPEILQQTDELIRGCECEDGCPACVGPAGENGVGGKNEALAILSLLNGKMDRNGISG